MAETAKAKERRTREGFFTKYVNGHGIDIGCGDDPLLPAGYGCIPWDKVNGDATDMDGIKDEAFDYVYSSHALEHLDFPGIAMNNWFRILKSGGYLLIFLPHRDRYERRRTLPSQFNSDHRTFWLPDRYEAPCTIGLVPLITQVLTGYELISCVVCDEGWRNAPPEEHAQGEYSIECVVRKL
jgi:SAM-dependent methyltransferase